MYYDPSGHLGEGIAKWWSDMGEGLRLLTNKEKRENSMQLIAQHGEDSPGKEAVLLFGALFGAASDLVQDPVTTIQETGGFVKDQITLSSDVRTAGFVSRHPIEAYKIGWGDPGKGKTDITNNAVRFSTNDLGLKENSAHEGSQVNAFRHVLWQATITKTFKNGAQIALEIGNAHEEDPYAIDGIKDFNKVRFSTLAKADESIDLLNNKIGREIGGNAKSLQMNEIAIATLDYFNKNGFWVAKKQPNGTYAIVQEKLSNAQHKVAYDRLKKLDSNGFTPEQAKKWQ